MNHQRYNLLTIFVALIGLVAIHHFAPGGPYTFGGHGALVNDIQRGVLALLALTHASLAGIMWTQRRHWDSAEASTFRFFSVKTIFWSFFAVTLAQRDGIPLTNAFLLTIVLLFAFDLDVQLVRRYLFFRMDDAQDVRQGDETGTARGMRAQDVIDERES